MRDRGIRVGYVLKVFPRLSQTFIANELRAHAHAGRRITVFSLRPPRSEDLDLIDPQFPYEVVYLSREHRSSDEAGLAESLAREAAARGMEHLHAHFGNLAARVARTAAQRVGVPYSFTSHAVDIYDKRVDGRSLAALVEQARPLITVSRYNAEHLASRFAVDPVVIYNGLPLERFAFNGTPRTGRDIVAVGRLVPKKGFRYLVEACALLRDRNVEFSCGIVGEGPEESALRQQIASAGLEDHVKLLGRRTPPEVSHLISAARMLAAPCVVAPSGDRDGLPTVLLEAMALGTPCISTDVTGIPEVLDHERTGLQVPQSDPVALAGACRRLLDDDALASQVAAAARSHIEREFDHHRTAASLSSAWSDSAAAEPVAGKVLFRIHNRRGLGHWMRSLNIAREIRAISREIDVLLLARRDPGLGLEGAGIATVTAGPEDGLGRLPSGLADDVRVVVDDTIALPLQNGVAARRVMVLRRCKPDRWEELLASDELRTVDRFIIPHDREEFGFTLPAWLESRSEFVGPIVRRGDPEHRKSLRERFRPPETTLLLLSTPGGGGFESDLDLFFATIGEVHRRLARDVSGFRHIVVLGPNCTRPLEPLDEAMIVLNSEPQLASLIEACDAVISAGGYNTVNEIRLAGVPAFLIPAPRKHDDQGQRAARLEREGLVVVAESDDAGAIARQFCRGLAEPSCLAAMRSVAARHPVEPGNRRAAEIILQCATITQSC